MQFVRILKHSCQAFIVPFNLCGSPWPGIPLYPLTLFLVSSSHNHSYSPVPFGCQARCGGVLTMGCLSSGFCISPHRDRVILDIQSGAMFEQDWKCTWRLPSGNYGDALRGCDSASLEIHFNVCNRVNMEAVIKPGWRYTWRVRSSEVWDTLAGCNRASLELHSEIMIEWVWRCTWRAWPNKIGVVLGGSQAGGGSLEGWHHGSWDSIHWLTHNCGYVGNWIQPALLRDKRLAGSERQSVLGWCSTQSIQYSVYVVLRVCCTRCMLYWVYTLLGVCCNWCMLYSVLTLDHGMEK
jgi:hypothetical protein